MSPILSTIKKSGRAAVIAVAIGAASVVAMPAMAQSAPSFNFSLGIGSGGESFSFGVERDGRSGFRRGDRRYCLNDREIVRGLRAHGYYDVEITRDLRGSRVEVEARYGRSWYVLRVDRCTGSVQVIERVRPLRPGRPGFGLQFNFGN
jgi:hypothetical protein